MPDTITRAELERIWQEALKEGLAETRETTGADKDTVRAGYLRMLTSLALQLGLDAQVSEIFWVEAIRRLREKREREQAS